MAGRRDDYRHLIRLVLLFGAALVMFFAIRAVLMPAGFGVYGHYRAGALDDSRQHPVRYAGQAVCVDCHSDIQTMRAAGRHARLSCEGCHGPLADHATDPGAAAATKPDGRAVCVRCHGQNRSRPSFMPQVVVKEHADEGPCTTCHQPHKPGLS